jgi:hypothetical protein
MYIIDWTKGYARPLLYKDTLIQFGYKFKEWGKPHSFIFCICKII